MVSFYWLSQQTARNESKETNAEKVLWGMILPHVTKKGIAAFTQFFGDSFYEQLGKPFKVSQHAFVSF